MPDPRDEAAEPASQKDAGSQPAESKVQVRDKRKLHQQAEPSGGANGEGAVQDQDMSAAPGPDAAGYLDDLRRLKAEFDNYRKRVLKEQTAFAEAAAVSIVSRLLSVMDNFELAVAAAEENRDFDRMLKGVEMVYGELRGVLKNEGLEPITAKGTAFDPNVHEAALEVPGDGSGVMMVAEVLRPGYKFKGKVLRPAMVKVTQGAPGA